MAFSPLIVGARLVLPGPALDGKSIYNILVGEHVTVTAGVPTVWQGLIDHMRQHKLQLSQLRKLIVGMLQPVSLAGIDLIPSKMAVHELSADRWSCGAGGDDQHP